MSNHLEGFIDRFEEQYAVVRLSDGQEIDWPLQNLPEDIAEGEAIRIYIKENGEKEEENAGRAKEILNEILKKNG